MATETQDTTATVEAPQGESYVQSILGAGEIGLDGPSADAGSSSQQAEADRSAGTTQDQGEGSTQEGEKPTGADNKAAFDELLAQYAQETGLNPDDPNQRKTLKRLVDKELFIRQLQATNKTAAEQAKAAETKGPELLTAFERELAAAEATAQTGKEPPQAGKEAPPEATGEQKNVEPFRYNDVGDEWKTPEDSLHALNEAWAENDMKQVHEIEMARLRRNFDSGIAPHFLRFIEKMVESRLQGLVERDLGDIVPEVRRSVQDRQQSESREFALDELRKAGAADIEKLFEVEDGPPIQYDGQEFPNTPLNRILAKYPEILRITENNSDPQKAQRKTFISRYKLAYQIFKSGSAGVSAETAKKLVEAGRESGEREIAARARQSINAGSGASGTGEKPANKSYIHELNNLPGEVPFASLL